jgi:hypothetical protein
LLARLRQDRLPRRNPNQRLSVDGLHEGMDECGAPWSRSLAASPAHARMPRSCADFWSAEDRHSLHECAAAGQEDRPVSSAKDFNWSVHLDGDKDMHDKSCARRGVYEKAVEADQARQIERLPVSYQLHVCSIPPNPTAWPNFFDDMNDWA